MVRLVRAAQDYRPDRKRAASTTVDELSPVAYNSYVIEVRETVAFSEWLAALRDRRAAARVVVRLARYAAGNSGDVRPVGEGVSELRIDYGPGYRVYVKQVGEVLVFVLGGGDKRTQTADIARAKTLAKEL